MPVSRVVLVRQVRSLGDGASGTLRRYFVAFGVVDSVLMSASHRAGKSGRPSNLAFVIMSDAAAVDRVLRVGELHMVAGHLLSMGRYERHDNCAEERVCADDARGYSLAPPEYAAPVDAACVYGHEALEQPAPPLPRWQVISL